MARVTGLEPATSCVTGRRSNQLSYTRMHLREPYFTISIFNLHTNASKTHVTKSHTVNSRITIRLNFW